MNKLKLYKLIRLNLTNNIECEKLPKNSCCFIVHTMFENALFSEALHTRMRNGGSLSLEGRECHQGKAHRGFKLRTEAVPSLHTEAATPPTLSTPFPLPCFIFLLGTQQHGLCLLWFPQHWEQWLAEILIYSSPNDSTVQPGPRITMQKTASSTAAIRLMGLAKDSLACRQNLAPRHLFL